MTFTLLTFLIFYKTSSLFFLKFEIIKNFQNIYIVILVLKVILFIRNYWAWVMGKGITKVKICISLDIDVYEKLRNICEETDAKISTKINTIITNEIVKKRKNE